jgi:3-oxoacyl-[acyl-carrier-protein] synthase II
MVVITGIGLACSLGLSADEAWQGVLQRRSSISPMPAIESSPPIDAGGYQAVELPIDFAAGLPRETRYLRRTIGQAIEQARAQCVLDERPRRCGIVLGTTLHGMRAGGAFFRSRDYSLLRNFLAGNTLEVAVEGMGFAGDALTTCSACSSSLASIALAVTLLNTGRLDLVVAGGYDTVSEYAFAGFNSLRLVAAGPLRPFAKDRKGMKLGEGYGIVVLERDEDARKRGVEPLATILGCGESSDAHHLTQPHPRGEGAAAAIRAALVDAQIPCASIGMISAHATGTPDNDAGEYSAYASVFGSDLRGIPVVALKSHVGHTLGGAGAVELIFSALALRDQTVPTTANTAPDEVEFAELSLISDAPRPTTIDATLNTSLGFGGANACVILTRSKISSAMLSSQNREVCISGVGVVLPGAVGNDAFLRRLSETPSDAMRDTGNIPEEQYIHLLNARRVRRMSDYVKLTLAAATLAFADASLTGDTAFAAACPAILGSTHAGAAYCVSYYQQIVREGMAAANPMLFAEGVPNSGAAHLSLMLSLKGSCQTIIGTRTAGLDALRLAYARIAAGQWDRAIVSAAEEFVPTVNSAYAPCGLHNPESTRGPFGGRSIAPSPGIPAFGSETQARRGESWGEGDLDDQRRSTPQNTLTPALSRTTGRGSKSSELRDARATNAGGFAIGCGAVTLVLESRQALERRGGKTRGHILACAGGILRTGHAVDDIAHALSEIQSPRHVISSANGTWIDAVELAALARASRGSVVSSLYGYFPETFGVGPLVGVAAAILRRKLPALNVPDCNLTTGLTAATGKEMIDAVGVLCTGFNGTVAGATIVLE